MDGQHLDDADAASNDDWVSAAAAATALEISERTVRRWCEEGRLTGRQSTTGRWSVSAASVESTAVSLRVASADLSPADDTSLLLELAMVRADRDSLRQQLAMAELREAEARRESARLRAVARQLRDALVGLSSSMIDEPADSPERP